MNKVTKNRATKKKLKAKAMKGEKSDRCLGRWLKYLAEKLGANRTE